jgi:hypothetical protein
MAVGKIFAGLLQTGDNGNRNIHLSGGISFATVLPKAAEVMVTASFISNTGYRVALLFTDKDDSAKATKLNHYTMLGDKESFSTPLFPKYQYRVHVRIYNSSATSAAGGSGDVLAFALGG